MCKHGQSACSPDSWAKQATFPTTIVLRLALHPQHSHSFAMQAISLMATPSELVDGRSDAIERKLECMSIKGYGPCNNATVDLNHVLDAIKENLRLEQRSVMELNFVAIHRVLSTVQVLVHIRVRWHGAAFPCSWSLTRPDRCRCCETDADAVRSQSQAIFRRSCCSISQP